MKNLLIKMSRRRSLMVPVVTLVAIGIGISGYYIQNRQIVAREQEQQAVQQEQLETQPTPATPEEVSPIETVEESTRTTEDGQPAEVVRLELVVTNQSQDSPVRLGVDIDSEKPGVCVFYLKQGNYGPEETISTTNKRCEVELQNPGAGTWEAKVLYTSEDGVTRGDAVQQVEL